jgi:hypothetical protein
MTCSIETAKGSQNMSRFIAFYRAVQFAFNGGELSTLLRWRRKERTSIEKKYEGIHFCRTLQFSHDGSWHDLLRQREA